MNSSNLIFILCLGGVSSVLATRKVSDRTLATIYHPEGTKIICQSDLRADLTERVPTLRDAIVRELTILDGKKLKIPVTDDEVERALGRVQEHLNLDRNELTAFFKKQGFTIPEATKELEKTIMLEKVIDTRIKKKAHVSRKALEQYHRDNPDIRYHLNQAFIPFNGSKALTREKVNREIVSGGIATSAQWQDIGEVPDKDISTEKSFIKALAPGSVAKSNESSEGITLVRLVEKKEKAFEERKNDIANILGQQRLMQAQQAYYDKLLSEANIHYHNPMS